MKAKPLRGPESEILTVAELAKFLRCNKGTIYKFANSGELPGFKLGSDWRFRVSEVEIWLRKSSNASRLRQLDVSTSPSYSKRAK